MIRSDNNIRKRWLSPLPARTAAAAGCGQVRVGVDLACEIGVDPSYAAYLLRLILLVSDIIETILTDEEPSGLSLTTLTKQLPSDWERQRGVLGFQEM